MTINNSTAEVSVIRSGTGWTVDVTNCNLSTNLSVKDFAVYINNVLISNTDFTKNSTTLITYGGSSIASSTVVVRRDTPIDRVQEVLYGDRFSSALWENELNRVHKILLELDQFGSASDPLTGVGSSGLTGHTASMASLRTINKPLAGTSALYYVRGFTTQGDGGGGFFYWDEADTSTTANSGYVELVASTSSNGRWKRIIEDSRFNVKWFGATGDGTTNDKEAIQRAINTIPRGATLVFPKGRYLIGDPILVWKSLTLEGVIGNDTETVGFGNVPQIFTSANFNTKDTRSMFIFLDRSFYDVSGGGVSSGGVLTFFFADPATPTTQRSQFVSGISANFPAANYFYNTIPYTVVKNLQFGGIGGEMCALNLFNGEYRIENCFFRQMDMGINVTSCYGAIIERCTSAAVNHFVYGSAEQASAVYGFLTYDAISNGIAAATNRVVLRNNFIATTGEPDSAKGFAFYLRNHGCNNIGIFENTIQGTKRGIKIAKYEGTAITFTTPVKVWNAGEYGVPVNNISIKENYFETTTERAIELGVPGSSSGTSEAPLDVVIQDNSFNESATTTNQGQIRLAGVDRCTIQRNNFRFTSASKPAIEFSGTTTTTRDNNKNITISDFVHWLGEVNPDLNIRLYPTDFWSANYTRSETGNQLTIGLHPSSTVITSFDVTNPGVGYRAVATTNNCFANLTALSVWLKFYRHMFDSVNVRNILVSLRLNAGAHTGQLELHSFPVPVVFVYNSGVTSGSWSSTNGESCMKLTNSMVTFTLGSFTFNVDNTHTPAAIWDGSACYFGLTMNSRLTFNNPTISVNGGAAPAGVRGFSSQHSELVIGTVTKGTANNFAAGLFVETLRGHTLLLTATNTAWASSTTSQGLLTLT